MHAQKHTQGAGRQTLYLYDSFGSADFQHLSAALAAISQCQVDNLSKLGELQK